MMRKLEDTLHDLDFERVTVVITTIDGEHEFGHTKGQRITNIEIGGEADDVCVTYEYEEADPAGKNPVTYVELFVTGFEMLHHVSIRAPKKPRSEPDSAVRQDELPFTRLRQIQNDTDEIAEIDRSEQEQAFRDGMADKLRETANDAMAALKPTVDAIKEQVVTDDDNAGLFVAEDDDRDFVGPHLQTGNIFRSQTEVVISGETDYDENHYWAARFSEGRAWFAVSRRSITHAKERAKSAIGLTTLYKHLRGVPATDEQVYRLCRMFADMADEQGLFMRGMEHLKAGALAINGEH